MTPDTLSAGHPNLSRVVGAVLACWAEHGSFLAQRFAAVDDPTLPISEEIAGLILRIAGDDVADYAAAYRWTCNALLKEDLYFRRKGRYRLSTFAEALQEVYSRPEFMDRYLRGLLLSQALWTNQAAAFDFYVERFLGQLKPQSDLLEIGPGHGLLLHFAAASPRVKSLTGWDVSDSSLAMTRHTLQAIGVPRAPHLVATNILETLTMSARFDAVVMSEVLEHLDQPQAALDGVLRLLRPGGLAYFNVPVYSPAPDHIYYWEGPAAVEEMVRQCGFDIVESTAAPTTGYDLERALRRKVTVNALVVARRP